jgi:hypothetical protein
MLLQLPNFKFQENPFGSSQVVTADAERERQKGRYSKAKRVNFAAFHYKSKKQKD